jgi:spore germination protein GerM
MSRRPALLALAALVAITMVAACGLPEDSSPRLITDEALPAELTDRPDVTAPIPPDEAELRQIYLVTTEGEGETSRLVAVEREMRRNDNTEAKITATLNSLINRGEDRTFRTFVPETLEVNGVTLDRGDDEGNGTLTIDLNGDMANVENIGQSLAYAQLVYTATQFPGVVNVRFTNNGEVASALNGTGESVPVVTRESYSDFAPAGG